MTFLQLGQRDRARALFAQVEALADDRDPTRGATCLRAPPGGTRLRAARRAQGRSFDFPAGPHGAARTERPPNSSVLTHSWGRDS